MTDSNIGEDAVAVAEILAALTKAAHDFAQRADTSAEYQLGAADAFERAETVIRDLAGWPVDPEPIIDEL